MEKNFRVIMATPFHSWIVCFHLVTELFPFVITSNGILFSLVVLCSLWTPLIKGKAVNWKLRIPTGHIKVTNENLLLPFAFTRLREEIFHDGTGLLVVRRQKVGHGTYDALQSGVMNGWMEGMEIDGKGIDKDELWRKW